MLPRAPKGHLVRWAQMGRWARWAPRTLKEPASVGLRSLQLAPVAHEASRFGRLAESERV